MKAACCKQEIEIQTDPKNCEYLVISGAVKKTEDYDEVEAETMLLPEQGGTTVEIILLRGLKYICKSSLRFQKADFCAWKQKEVPPGGVKTVHQLT